MRSEVSRDGYPLPFRSSPRKPTRASSLRAAATSCVGRRCSTALIQWPGSNGKPPSRCDTLLRQVVHACDAPLVVLAPVLVRQRRRAVGVEALDRPQAPGLALLALLLGPDDRLPV